MASVVEAAGRDGISVVLSSHVLAELERVATYLVVLARGQVQVAGPVAELVASHGAGLEGIALRHLRAGLSSLSRTDGAP
jgi:ABC-type multidrug transport system ATPase subunit